MNLISNACKFTEQGYIRCGVSLISKEDDIEQLRLEIKDTGIGLTSEVSEKIFEEITQADNTATRSYGGTGLGLPITKKLTDLMGGVIGVDSTKDEGATFRIDGLLEVAKPPKASKFSSLKNVRILFVAESHEYRNMFQRRINHMEADVTIISDSHKVMSLLSEADKEKNPFRIVILDNGMVSINSVELGVEIRKKHQYDELKLLILSSVGQVYDTTAFSKAGFNACLNKIFLYETLNNILSSMLSHSIDSPIITPYSINDINQAVVWQDGKFNISVLLVEDNFTNQMIAKNLLMKMGVDVKVANNGQEAVDKFNSDVFDFIFMDCQMPIMDGYQATIGIRELEKEKNKPETPIVALTANTSNADRILCMNSGMNDVVTKPFRKTDLSDSLLKWLPHLTS